MQAPVQSPYVQYSMWILFPAMWSVCQFSENNSFQDLNPTEANEASACDKLQRQHKQCHSPWTWLHSTLNKRQRDQVYSCLFKVMTGDLRQSVTSYNMLTLTSQNCMSCLILKLIYCYLMFQVLKRYCCLFFVSWQSRILYSPSPSWIGGI